MLEYGALISIKAVDIPAFERHVAQLKTYYNDCSIQPESQRRFPILGLNLLRLLAQNRIAEFHTELELLPSEVTSSNVYIKFPAQLEQHIMEGSYNRVLSAKQEGQYAQEGMYFMDQLVNTVRVPRSSCCSGCCVAPAAAAALGAARHGCAACAILARSSAAAGARGDRRVQREGVRLRLER